MPQTYYIENAMLNHVLRNTAYVQPASVFVGLFTATPTPAGGGTEVSGLGYARVAAAFSAPVDGVLSNSVTVSFPTAGGAWGTVTHFGVFDALAAGHLLYYGTLANPHTVITNDSTQFPSGQLVVTAT